MNSNNLLELATLGYTVVDAIEPESDGFIDAVYSDYKEWLDIVKPPVPPHGVMNHYNVGHLNHVWQIRIHDGVRTPFEKIWKTTDLAVSFDGFGYIPADLNRKDRMWLHFDQAPKNRGFKCVQGMVALTDNEIGGRVFSCVPKSHLGFSTYFMKKPPANPSKAFQKLESLEDFNLSTGFDHEIVQVPLCRGQMLLWDSRLAHQNNYGESGSERLVQYVSYLPRSGMSKSDGQKRLRAFQEKRTTSHWAYPVRMNGLQPQTYGDSTKLIDYSKLPEIKYDQWTYELITELL